MANCFFVSFCGLYISYPSHHFIINSLFIEWFDNVNPSDGIRDLLVLISERNRSKAAVPIMEAE
jgi:hypothetical protein